MTSLDREGRVFSRYLLGAVADGAMLDTFTAAVENGSAGPLPEPVAFERLLTKIARIGPLTTRTVDVYARHFCPAAPVRKRLILMLAILESHAGPYAAIDTVDGGGRLLVYLRIGAAAISSLVLLALATVFLSPMRLVLAGRRAGPG